MRRFAATYSEAVQIGESEWQQVRTTKVFCYSDSLELVMSWLASLGVKNPSLSSVTLSEVDE